MPNYNEIVDDKTKVNNAFLGIEKNYRDTALALNKVANVMAQYRRNGCTASTQSALCTDLLLRANAAEAEAQQALLAFNNDGKTMSANVKELGFDVKS